MNPFDPNFTQANLKLFSKTQEDLARDMGVSVGTVNRWLRGKRKPLKIYQKLLEGILDGYEETYLEEQARQQRAS